VLGRFVADAGCQRTHECVRYVLAERQRCGGLAPPEIEIDRLTHQLGHRHAPSGSTMPKLLVGPFGEAQVGRPIPRHRDITLGRRRSWGQVVAVAAAGVGVAGTRLER
jgi:hypothetical protein